MFTIKLIKIENMKREEENFVCDTNDQHCFIPIVIRICLSN